MWIVTPRGFFSAVAKPEDGDEFVTVQARTEQDICNVADLIDAEPARSEHSDYRWRIRCPRDDWERAGAKMAGEIDYDNFKNRIAHGEDGRGADPERAHLLADVGWTLYRLQSEDG